MNLGSTDHPKRWALLVSWLCTPSSGICTSCAEGGRGQWWRSPAEGLLAVCGYWQWGPCLLWASFGPSSPQPFSPTQRGFDSSLQGKPLAFLRGTSCPRCIGTDPSGVSPEAETPLLRGLCCGNDPDSACLWVWACHGPWEPCIRVQFGCLHHWCQLHYPMASSTRLGAGQYHTRPGVLVVGHPIPRCEQPNLPLPCHVFLHTMLLVQMAPIIQVQGSQRTILLFFSFPPFLHHPLSTALPEPHHLLQEKEINCFLLVCVLNGLKIALVPFGSGQYMDNPEFLPALVPAPQLYSLGVHSGICLPSVPKCLLPCCNPGR